MAQTTRSASFGPVFVVYAFHPSPSGTFRRLQSTYTIKEKLVLIKHEGIKKKTYQMAQTTCSASFGPDFVNPAFHKSSHTFKTLIVPIYVS